MKKNNKGFFSSELLAVIIGFVIIIGFMVIALLFYLGTDKTATSEVMECTVLDKYVSGGKVTHHNIIVTPIQETDNSEYTIIVTTDLYNEINIGDSMICKAYFDEKDNIVDMDITSSKDTFEHIDYTE